MKYQQFPIISNRAHVRLNCVHWQTGLHKAIRSRQVVPEVARNGSGSQRAPLGAYSPALITTHASEMTNLE